MNSLRRLYIWIPLTLLLAWVGVMSTRSLAAKVPTMELTFRYTGTRIAAPVTVIQSMKGGSETIRFDGVVQPGEVFTVGAPCDGTSDSLVSILVDGELNTSIPTNCQRTLSPLVAGNFVVVDVDGWDQRGGDFGTGSVTDKKADADEMEGCDKCAGKVTELTLRYNGEEEAFVQVTQKDGGEEVVVFEDFVQPGEPFTFAGADKNGTLGSSIKIYVDDELAESIHTSCSKPIGPGLVAGDFEVVDGSSHKGGRLCPLPVENEGCGKCEGKVTELILRYNGEAEAFVQVTQKGKGKGREVMVFEGLVQPGESFAFEGADKNGTLGSSIKIYVDGELAESIHTSCSKPIGPGLVAGDFEVVDGSSRKGGRLCPLPEEDRGCDECTGQVTELTLRYHGEMEALVRVTQVAAGQELVVFEDFVQPGEPFTFSGDVQQGNLGSSINISVDDELVASVDTNCTQSIGPGLVAGGFEVIEGFSDEGGRLCALPPDVNGCDKCEGKVTELTLRYHGAEEAFIQVTQKDGGGEVVVFEDFVQPGEPFTFAGADKNGTLGTRIEIFVDNRLAERMHTSCSQPIGPGLVAGDFEVIEGSSRKGGPLCALGGG